MDFNLTEEQIELKEAARNYAQNELTDLCLIYTSDAADDQL